jgi:preprotein translocase subunit SecA
MNKQREAIYTLRRELLEGQIHLDEEEVVDTRGYLMELAGDLLDDTVEKFCGAEEVEDWNIEGLKQEAARLFAIETADLDFSSSSPDDMYDAMWDRIAARYEEKEQIVGRELLKRVERDIMLQIVDTQWKDHLFSLDHLKEGIGLRGYGQRDPLVEYKKESFDLFQDMKARIDEETVRYLWWLRPVVGNEEETMVRRRQARRVAPMVMNNPSAAVPAFAGAAAGGGGVATEPAAAARQAPRTGGDDAKVHTVRRDTPKVGRNDPCPCGSGRKYKKCHGAGAGA